MRRLADQRGQTTIELLVGMALMGIIMVGIVNVFVSGTRAGANANARIDAQQNTRLAVDRLEFEGRCSRAATLVNGGAGVTFTLPTQCSHATGTVTWCVVGDVLERFTTGSCTGTGQVFVSGLTSATPFSLPAAPTGDLPQLGIAITVNASNNPGTAVTLDDTVTLRNAAPAS